MTERQSSLLRVGVSLPGTRGRRPRSISRALWRREKTNCKDTATTCQKQKPSRKTAFRIRSKAPAERRPSESVSVPGSLVSHLTTARARLHVLEVLRDASETEGVAAQGGEGVGENLPAHRTDVAVVQTHRGGVDASAHVHLGHTRDTSTHAHAHTHSHTHTHTLSLSPSLFLNPLSLI